jgi:hypothetical protein
MNTTAKTVSDEADEYASSYNAEDSKPAKACNGCKTPRYCAQNGCQAKAAADLKKVVAK